MGITTLIVFGAQFLYLIIVALALITFLLMGKRTKKDFLLLALPSFIVSYVIAIVCGHFIVSPRPFIVEHVQPLIVSAHDNGFPSDHTLLSMTVALVVFAYRKKTGAALIILAMIVGLCRVLAFVHHPIDVIGSIAISIASVFGVDQVLKYLRMNPVL